jgi:3-mercaptopyruvate sulfurtransferase SseA
VALQLRRYGIRNVRPLLGGYYAWKDLGLPLVKVLPPEEEVEGGMTLASEDAG